MKLPEKERQRLVIEWAKVLVKAGISTDTPNELLPFHLQFDNWVKKQKRQIETPQEYTELLKECVAAVKFYIDKAVDKCGVRLPYPVVRFDIKGTTAGTAQFNPRNPEKSIIRFSPVLLRENANDFLVSTTGHEVAHLVARAKYGSIDPHGAEWQRVMWAFSLPATRCHNYDTSNVSTRVGKTRQKPNPVRQKIDGGTVVFAAGAKIIEFD